MYISSDGVYNMKFDKGMFNDQFFFPKIEFESPLTLFLVGRTRPLQEHFMLPLTSPLDPALSCYQLEYVTAGKGYIEIDGKTYTVEKGDFFFINKSNPRILSSDADFPLKKLFITAKGKLLDSLLESFGIIQSILIVKTDVSEYFENIIRLLEEATQYTIAECNKICVEILKIIQKVNLATQTISEAPNDKNVLAENILNYIDSNIGQKITIDDLCKQFYVGKTQLIYNFKSKYGITPIKYVQGQKIVTAKYYLRVTNITISELSGMLHFTDSKHFTKVFKEYTGISPREYRTNNRQFGAKELHAFHHDDYEKEIPKKKRAASRD